MGSLFSDVAWGLFQLSYTTQGVSGLCLLGGSTWIIYCVRDHSIILQREAWPQTFPIQSFSQEAGHLHPTGWDILHVGQGGLTQMAMEGGQSANPRWCVPLLRRTS